MTPASRTASHQSLTKDSEGQKMLPPLSYDALKQEVESGFNRTEYAIVSPIDSKGVNNNVISSSSSPPHSSRYSQLSDDPSLASPGPQSTPHNTLRMSSHFTTSSPLSSLPPSSPPPATPHLLHSPVFGSLLQGLPPSSPPPASLYPTSSSPLSSVPDHIRLDSGLKQAVFHSPISSPLSSLPEEYLHNLNELATGSPCSDRSSASLVSVNRSSSSGSFDPEDLVGYARGQREPSVIFINSQDSLLEANNALESPHLDFGTYSNNELDQMESKPLQIQGAKSDFGLHPNRNLLLPSIWVESDPEPKDEEPDSTWTLQEAMQETGESAEVKEEDIKKGATSTAEDARLPAFGQSAEFSSPKLYQTQGNESQMLLLWDTQGEHNPLWDFQTAEMIGEHVVDLVSQYLGYQAFLSCATGVSTVVVPPSIFHAVLIHNPGDEVHKMLWTPHNPPSRILLPVVDLARLHCYLWYGDIERASGRSSITLNYLDSLGAPKQKDWHTRFDAVHKVIKYLFPGIDGTIKGEINRLPGYRQDTGSLDCGIFMCQAMSAIVFGAREALSNLLPVYEVRTRIKHILAECRNGALEYLAEGRYSTQITILHRVVLPDPPPLRSAASKENTGVTYTIGTTDSDFSLRDKEATARIRRPHCYSRSEQSLGHSSVPPRRPLIHEEKTYVESSGAEILSNSRRATSALSGFSFVYGRSTTRRFPSIPEYSYEAFFDDLTAPESLWPSGRIANGGGRDHQLLLQAALLSEPIRRSRAQSGISVVDSHLVKPDSGSSIGEYIATIRDIENRDPRAKVWAFLTGQVAGKQLALNWLKDSVHPDEEWMDIALDIDSLSLTVDEPEFSMPVAVNAYPARASTLSSDNGLRIWVDGQKRPLSHFLNFTCFTLGSNNQFRVNIFYPSYIVPRLNNQRYRTFMEAADYEQWYDKVFMYALELVSRKVPPNLRLACIQAAVELPPTYASAQARAHLTDGGRNFAGYKITHEVLNMIIPEMRRIVNTTQELAKFRDYFFHIWGTNLKTVGQRVDGRAGDNPLLHIFRTYPIVPWEKQNPQDIFVDVAVEIFINSDRLPADLGYVTMIWNSKAIAELMGSTYLSHQHDAYMHSQIVGGLRAFTTGLDTHSIVKFQCYQKDMKQTYIHGDNSLGTGFSPQDALGSTKRYFTQMTKLNAAWSYQSSFGIRAEWRSNAWAANQMLQMDPYRWLTRFLEVQAIVVHTTLSVFNLKSYALMLYRKSISLQQQLTLRERSREEVQLLVLVTTYLIKGLVKRPDDMSSSRTMADRLNLIQRAVRYGFPTLQPHMLSDCVTRLTGQVEKEEWSILNFLRCKQPGGARLKTSFSSKPALTILPSPPAGVTGSQLQGPSPLSAVLTGPNPDSKELSDDDMEWSRCFVNERLSTWLWARFPEHHLRMHAKQPICFKGPWRIAGWHRTVSEDVQPGFRIRTRKNFQAVADELLPLDWISNSSEGQWRTYQDSVLNHIRNRIVRRGAPSPQRFATQLRDALQLHLHDWDYLPATQKHKCILLSLADKNILAPD
ncbi:hypothetical protein FRC07_012664 [Ceratobasidium sp. 392]|nr:hypothetical protein FRC07_012664 [Ceratobasidium sp. 392]